MMIASNINKQKIGATPSKCPAPIVSVANNPSIGNLEKLSTWVPSDEVSAQFKKTLLSKNNYGIPIYLRDMNEDNKQINVFDSVLKLTAVKFVTGCAMDELSGLYQDKERIAHINIGMGKGFFEAKLFEQLIRDEKSRIREINVYGIDIDSSSLEVAHENIQQALNRVKPEIQLNFTPIVGFVEKLEKSKWTAIAKGSHDVVGAVAQFSLHHIPSKEERLSVLKSLVSINPDKILVTEPDVNHFNPDFKERVITCWDYFSNVFEMIDSEKGLDQNDRAALKKTFFGREIDDIVGNTEEHRTERHEPASRWVDHMKQAGLMMIVPRANTLNQTVSMKSNKEYVSIEYKERSVLSLMIGAVPKS